MIIKKHKKAATNSWSRTRSPIKGNVPRQAGQGLRNYRESLVDSAVLRAVLPIFFAIFWLVLELLHRNGYFTSFWFIGILIVVGLANFVFLWIRTRRKAQCLIQGEDGERYVAKIIEQQLLPHGYRVFHDLPCKVQGRSFNIDHLLIGPNGIFSIETKSWSKPLKGETVAVFDGRRVFLNGMETNPNPIAQAIAIAKEAENLIFRQTSIRVKVMPFLVVVGWFVRKSFSGPTDVSVVNEQALPSFVMNTPGSLPPETLNSIIRHLSES